MKKFFVFICLVLISFAFVGCGGETPEQPDDKKPEFTLKEDSIEVYVGETYEIKVDTKNFGENDKLEYKSEDESILKLEGNIISALKVGTTKVFVKFVSETDATCPDKEITVTVKEKLIPSITLIGALTTKVGESVNLEVIKLNLVEEIIWTSSNPEVATVENGVVTGIKAGKTIITAKSGEAEDSVEFEVLEDAQIIISGETELFVGKSITLTAELEGYSGSFIWETIDETVAIVKNGVVTGKSTGLATIIVKAGDKTASFNIKVSELPVLEISGKDVVYIGKTVKFSATANGAEANFTWSSSNIDVATVDNEGKVTGVTAGVTFISAYLNGENIKMKVTVSEEPDQVVLYFDGGVSNELYKKTTSVANLTLNNFNANEGDFWGNKAYATHIHITDSSHDPQATFSDRIYIGKNPNTGFYEIINVILSGSSSWPEGAEYVITISSSYNGYRAAHAQAQKLKAGMIVILDKNITSISGSNPCSASFYKKDIDIDTITYTSEEYKSLPIPSRLGFKFLGWHDEEGNLVQRISEVKGSLELTAKWEELNPVTDIITSNLPTEMLTDEVVVLDSKVTPSDAYFTDVLFESSNTNILDVDKDGKLVAVNAGKATLTIKDYVGRVVKNYEIVVNCVPSLDLKFDSVHNGLLNIGEEVYIIGKFVGKDGDKVQISYESSNPAIATVDENGLVKATGKGRATITSKATYEGTNYSLSLEVSVEETSTATKIDEVIKLIMDNHFGVVETGNACLYNDGTQRYYKATYGSVNRILFDAFEVNREYAETAANNTSGRKDRRPTDTIEFVTVHDTATLTGTVVSIASNMANGTTTIHYTTGNGAIYQVVPEKYIAYHAGDGTSTTFRWLATGVKTSDNSAPKVTVVKDGASYYFAINGTKTNLMAPITNGSQTLADPLNSLTELGPVWKIENGEYFIGNTWTCFSQVAKGVIGSYGGNNNSIGIEMCVNTTSDMYDTYQRTAQLVADICIRNNLDLTRVKQHNTWTGKNCPQVILAGNYWDSFMKMVEAEYRLQKDYKGITITMKSNNPDIVDNTGRVIVPPLITTTVSYEVTISDGTNSKTITLASVIPGTTTWEQGNGRYPSSLIWNNGNFVR